MGFKQNVSGLFQCIFVVAYRFRDMRGWEKVPTPQISIIYFKSDCKFLFVLAKFFKEFPLCLYFSNKCRILQFCWTIIIFSKLNHYPFFKNMC